MYDNEAAEREKVNSCETEKNTKAYRHSFFIAYCIEHFTSADVTNIN